MADSIRMLGMIAGNRRFPLVFAREARAAGIQRLVAVAFEGETDPALGGLVDEMVWLKVGQLQKLIDTFKKWGVREVVMVGQLAPKNLFANLRLDFRMMGLLARLKRRNAETIFGAVGEELARDGLVLAPHAQFLSRIVPGAGVLTQRKPSTEEREDMVFGFNIGKAVAALDIGQTVVVKRGTVLAVEAFEGTDAALLRGGQLGQGDAVAVKLTKEGQDMRFDIPCIGCETIETLKKAGIKALAIEAGRTLLLEKDELLRAADEAGMAVEALDGRGLEAAPEKNFWKKLKALDK
ncbi:MAG: UDP-2,3-diacylglucosamine diphosphatase LpxI [Verrucomicrobiae bacterium]|nr:UDP-2,3-diacylglucosamine diphosphatase LpxI [Verrucomicrobiae bacterium]